MVALHFYWLSVDQSAAVVLFARDALTFHGGSFIASVLVSCVEVLDNIET